MDNFKGIFPLNCSIICNLLYTTQKRGTGHRVNVYRASIPGMSDSANLSVVTQ